MYHSTGFSSVFPFSSSLIIWLFIAQLPVIAVLGYVVSLLKKLPGLSELEDQTVTEIIKKRYVLGEISSEEMDEMIKRVKSAD